MPSVCFYFQVHQPNRLRHYSHDQIHHHHNYFDNTRNSEIMRKVANKCYLPTNQKMLELIHRFKGRFKITYSITGVCLEQMMSFSPETLKSFIELAQTGCVEFLAETYYHSLAALYDADEFHYQIEKHVQTIKHFFSQQPLVFRNTELVHSDIIGQLISKMGFKAVLAEGADDILQWRSPNFLYRAPHYKLPILLKNYRLSDDIAFRFSNRNWIEYPLTAPKFASWIHRVSGEGDLVNLFMDYETFGEHQWCDTGIFDFIDYLPGEILKHPDWNFVTPSEAIIKYPTVADLSFPRNVSWADLERDLTAWQGNLMQQRALQEIFSLSKQVHQSRKSEISESWRKLMTSDHYYYMCTKWFSDGDVHAYFSSYKSPYEAFLNFMNVLKDFRHELTSHTEQGNLI